MDKLRAMEIFIRIADAGSLSGAARLLDVSVPMVVRDLARLECYLNTRLIQRSTRKLSLTEEGQHYLQACRRIVSEAHDAEASLSARAIEAVGLLTITAPVMFGHMYVAPLVVRFTHRHPRVRCKLITDDRPLNLVEQGIDLAIRIAHLNDSSLVALPMTSTRAVIVASPKFLEENGIPNVPGELKSSKCVVHSRHFLWKFHERGSEMVVQVNSHLEFTLLASALEACANHAGFGIFYFYQVQPYLNNNRLQIVLAEYEMPSVPINVVYPSGRSLATRTRAFIDFMKEEFEC